MTKLKEICRYRLLCLINGDQYHRVIKDINGLLSDAEVKEETWKPAYTIKGIEDGRYVSIRFSSSSCETKKLNEFLKEKNFRMRYLLTNEDKKAWRVKNDVVQKIKKE